MKAIIKNEDTLKEIQNELMYGSLKQIEIANKYSISKRLVSAINRGTSYITEGLNYPLRKRKNDTWTQETCENIYSALLNTADTIRKIASDNNVSTFFVSEIRDEKRFKNKTKVIL